MDKNVKIFDTSNKNSTRASKKLHNFIIYLGAILFGILFFLSIRFNFPFLIAIFVFSIFNIWFCKIYNEKSENSMINFFLRCLPIMIISAILISIVCMILIFLTPFPECIDSECLDRLSYGLSFIAAPLFSIPSYIPMLINLFIIGFKKQKDTLRIFAIITLIFACCLIIFSKQPLKTNKIKETLDFDKIEITYDTLNKKPHFNTKEEKIKYFEKEKNSYYFVLKPGTYDIEMYTTSPFYEILYANTFYKHNNFLNTYSHDIKIQDVKKNNLIYSYDLDRNNIDYLYLHGEIIYENKSNNRTIIRYIFDDERLLYVFDFDLENGITITKIK